MNTPKKSKTTLAILFAILMMCIVYFLFGRSALSLNEGIFAILQKLSSAMFFLFVPIGVYFCFQEIKQGNESLYDDFKSIIVIIFGLWFCFEFIKDTMDSAYYAIFETQKTAISEQYQVYYREYNGQKDYFLAFNDKDNMKPCDTQNQKCRYTYKVQINAKTYEKLTDYNLKGDNLSNPIPLQLTFKPKAQILMHWKLQ